MTHASLFSGIGGFDLAAEWAGWENLFHCEWNPFGQKVLKHHFPKSISYEDITKTNFSIHKGSVDILTGGFPCQPYSTAGKRLGTADIRHLWPHMLRTIREVQPRWVVGENVRGLTNWNGGVVFDEVQADLEAEGYEVTPFLLPACAVNAPHRRDRIWFVAYSNSNGQQRSNSEYEVNTSQGGINALGNTKQMGEYDVTNSTSIRGNKDECGNNGESNEPNKDGEARIISNPKNIGQEYALENGELERRRFRQSNQRNFWNSFPSQSPICGGDDGLPKQLDNITFSKWRNESIKAYGNAIVPQVAYQIFKAINKYEKFNHNT